MIPVRLHLRNFLSYGDACEPIDFAGIHVACLCGPNGHGKSALLDAMTWALWGQARSNSAADLVRLQQPDMAVDFEFRLDGQEYRVLRKWTRGRASGSDLQFQSREEDGQWRSLTGQGVRATQERINQTLRMDYETFINSAFLVQGRADEFARRTAGERKRILGEILNLRLYDELAEAARTRRGAAAARATATEADLLRLEAEHARLPLLQETLTRLETEHGAAQLASAEARAAHGQVLVEKARLDARRRERDDLLRRLAAVEAELAPLRRQLGATQVRIEAAEALLKRGEVVREAAQTLTKLRAEGEAWNAALVQLRMLETTRNAALRALETARCEVERERDVARERQRNLEARVAQAVTIRTEHARLAGGQERLTALREERAKLEVRPAELAAERAEAQASQRQCATELAEVEERFEKLKAARAICPLCEGELTEEKRKELGRQLKARKAELTEATNRAREQEERTKGEEAEVRRKLALLDRQLREGEAEGRKLATLEEQLRQMVEIEGELPKVREAVQYAERRLSAGEYGAESRAEAERLEAEIRGLEYNERRHGELAGKIRGLEGAERDLRALELAEASLPGDRLQATELETALRVREEAAADDQASRREADRELEQAPQVEAEASRLRTCLELAEREEARLTGELGAAREALTRCTALAGEIAERKRERAAAAADAAAYEELAKAFGRNGIQALIIENSLPQIEEEANRLLDRMSSDALRIRLLSQKDLKGGGQAETLEIEISDGMGPRRYELYSGGEAFRVNFALRIALSRLLATRAGARLETLFIDEGFGSQDEEGRQRLVEAIQAVQGDFGTILVITHIDELKDAFPTRIEVTKGPRGSQVAIY
jgi:exonuclease SbcC